ncbi:MAG TPA: hypothetical protein VN228_11050 [Pyrinomonadaceae bacterium]|nr:hypothetical protein [Pyrinomonadaceae bacterium]
MDFTSVSLRQSFRGLRAGCDAPIFVGDEARADGPRPAGGITSPGDAVPAFASAPRGMGGGTEAAALEGRLGARAGTQRAEVRVVRERDRRGPHLRALVTSGPTAARRDRASSIILAADDALFRHAQAAPESAARTG